MQSIQQLAGRIRLGVPVGSDALCMVPVMRESPSRLKYQALQTALAAKTLRITEMSAGGSVPEVRVINVGDLPVLLLDGAALVGAKQNRVINLTVLVSAHAETIVPVSCVEQGRWRSASPEFTEGKSLHFAAARSQKMRDVSESLELCGRPASNQGKVWADMADYSATFGAEAPSGAMQDVYRAVEDSAERLLDALRPAPGQVGAAFVARGRLLGLDAFDSAATFKAEFAKVARSYAVEAMRRREATDEVDDGKGRASEIVGALLWQLASGQWKSYAGVGLGTDIRMTTSRLAAGALVHEEETVHLAAFPGNAEEGRADVSHAPAMPRRRGV